MIVPVTVIQIPVTVIQIFDSIAELGAANLSYWSLKLTRAVTQKLGVGLLSDIFRISDFFWKLGGGIILVIKHGTILGSVQYT